MSNHEDLASQPRIAQRDAEKERFSDHERIIAIKQQAKQQGFKL